MEEKTAMLSSFQDSRSRRRAGYFIATFIIFFWFPVMYFIQPFAWTTTTSEGGWTGENDAPVVGTKKLVPVEAHIMSKCPDARDCLKEMVLPAMQRVGDKVDFTLSFIGTPTDNDGVACKHGPAECLGNIIELCAQKLYPEPKTYLGFVMCLTRDYEEIPQRSLIEDCALEHAIDFQKLNECATKDDGAFGIEMLRGSVQRSANAGVTKSCTVRLNEELYCVRDGGEWTDCPSGPGVNDLVIAVEKLYRSS
jgi:hypothetical protein